MDYPAIADYGLIGDCRTVALVSRDGSVDWYCPERFDAPAVFCRMLDINQGGFLRVAPAGRFSTSRRYHGDTNVLETTFETDAGRVRLTDFMPVHAEPNASDPSRIVRGIEALDGPTEVEVAFKATFDYARASCSLSAVSTGGAVVRSERGMLSLVCAGLQLTPANDGSARGALRLNTGQRVWLIVSASEPDQSSGIDCEAELQRMLEHWRGWADQCAYRGPHRAKVVRSALALKLLTYVPTGAVVAAPTTSLPEAIGGVRNWDYRFTWLRDGSLMLYALSTLGYHHSATDFLKWLERTILADPTATPQIMYRIDGSRELAENELKHLDGYSGSKPVRIGNGAVTQHQLDIFGDVLTAAHHFYGGDDEGFGVVQADRRVPAEAWRLLRGLVEQAVDSWQQPDSGIWEVRGGPRHFTYSKLMCWAAVDRGILLAEGQHLEAPLDRWRAARDDICQAILTRGFDPKLGAFTQVLDEPDLDASVLAIPRFGFLPATDPRMQSTVDVIRSQLTSNGLVLRYRSHDGLPGSEGSFLLCTFWMVDALALGGRLDEARELFDRLTGFCNDLGLLSEEVDAGRGLLLGNFPQGFSHMALIGSAVDLAKAAKHGPEHEAQTQARRADQARAAGAEGHG